MYHCFVHIYSLYMSLMRGGNDINHDLLKKEGEKCFLQVKKQVFFFQIAKSDFQLFYFLFSLSKLDIFIFFRLKIRENWPFI